METEILRHIPADIHNHSTLSPDGCDERMRMASLRAGNKALCADGSY